MTAAHNFLHNYPEVPLSNAPLTTVVSQVSFASILVIQNQNAISSFQNLIREDYPSFKIDKHQAATLDLGASKMNVVDQPIWRFIDIKEEWKVTLTQDSIAVETSNYQSKKDFSTRFAKVLAAFTKELKPQHVSRIGIRYVNRIEGDAALNKLGEFINPSMLGILNSNAKPSLEFTVTEALFRITSQVLFARWGFLPPNATTDPAVIKPKPNSSWILDIDASNSTQATWDVKSILTEIEALSAIDYNFFRWAVTNPFLSFYGGKV